MVFKDKSTELKVFAAIYTVPAILHTVGLYMLFTTRITISISELCICLLKISHRLLSLHDYTVLAFKLWTIQTSGCFMAYILFMVLLSVDRFLEVFLNIKYPLLVTSRTVRFSVISAWAASVIFALVLVLQNSANQVRNVVILYFWPSSELTFLLIALLVYTYLFVKIRQYRKKTNRISVRTDGVPATRNHHITGSTTVGCFNSAVGDNITDRPNNGISSRRKSRYRYRLYLPTFLVASFVILWIIPDQVEFVAIVMGRNIPPYFWFLINVLITSALCMDAFIYIFGVKEIKNRILKSRWWFDCSCKRMTIA